MDRESDPGLRRDIQETLVHMITSSATSGKLGHWLKLCKDVLSATTGELKSIIDSSSSVAVNRNLYCDGLTLTDCGAPVEATQEEEEADSGRDDDSSAFSARPESGGPFTALRWGTRRFAMACVCRIIEQCESTDPAHFDMALAQERRLNESTGKIRLDLCPWTTSPTSVTFQLSFPRLPGSSSRGPGPHGVHGGYGSQ